MRQVCASIHQLPDIVPQAGKFENVICTQVFEHLEDPFGAARALYEVLRPGGKLVWTAPFIEAHHEGPDFGDYWRFTVLGARQILEKAGFVVLVCESAGTTWATASSLLGLGLHDVSMDDQIDQPHGESQDHSDGQEVSKEARYLGVHILAQKAEIG